MAEKVDDNWNKKKGWGIWADIGAIALLLVGIDVAADILRS